MFASIQWPTHLLSQDLSQFGNLLPHAPPPCNLQRCCFWQRSLVQLALLTGKLNLLLASRNQRSSSAQIDLPACFDDTTSWKPRHAGTDVTDVVLKLFIERCRKNEAEDWIANSIDNQSKQNPCCHYCVLHVILRDSVWRPLYTSSVVAVSLCAAEIRQTLNSFNIWAVFAIFAFQRVKQFGRWNFLQIFYNLQTTALLTKLEFLTDCYKSMAKIR